MFKMMTNISCKVKNNVYVLHSGSASVEVAGIAEHEFVTDSSADARCWGNIENPDEMAFIMQRFGEVGALGIGMNGVEIKEKQNTYKKAVASSDENSRSCIHIRAR
jgi:hypothetical protein